MNSSDSEAGCWNFFNLSIKTSMLVGILSCRLGEREYLRMMYTQKIWRLALKKPMPIKAIFVIAVNYLLVPFIAGETVLASHKIYPCNHKRQHTPRAIPHRSCRYRVSRIMAR